jgi:hypothetical protein
MSKKLALVAGLLVLTGCATKNVQVYNQIDADDKTVTVPFGADGLKGKLKQALANDGWKMMVYKGPEVTKGTLGADTNVQHYDTFNSRYQLLVSYSQYDWCLNFSPAIDYDISLVDTKSGAEVLTVNGRDCESHAVDAFVEALHGKKN